MKPFGWVFLLFFPIVGGYVSLDVIEGNVMLTGRTAFDWRLDLVLPLVVIICMWLAGAGAGSSLPTNVNNATRARWLGIVSAIGLGVSAVSLAIRILAENNGTIPGHVLENYFETIGAGVLLVVSLVLMSLGFALSGTNDSPHNRQPV